MLKISHNTESQVELLQPVAGYSFAAMVLVREDVSMVLLCVKSPKNTRNIINNVII